MSLVRDEFDSRIFSHSIDSRKVALADLLVSYGVDVQLAGYVDESGVLCEEQCSIDRLHADVSCGSMADVHRCLFIPDIMLWFTSRSGDLVSFFIFSFYSFIHFLHDCFCC